MSKCFTETTPCLDNTHVQVCALSLKLKIEAYLAIYEPTNITSYKCNIRLH